MHSNVPAIHSQKTCIFCVVVHNILENKRTRFLQRNFFMQLGLTINGRDEYEKQFSFNLMKNLQQIRPFELCNLIWWCVLIVFGVWNGFKEALDFKSIHILTFTS